MASIAFKRGTRAQIDAAATGSQLVAGEPYLITDEGRFAIGTSATTYVVAPLPSEVVPSSGYATPGEILTVQGDGTLATEAVETIPTVPATGTSHLGSSDGALVWTNTADLATLLGVVPAPPAGYEYAITGSAPNYALSIVATDVTAPAVPTGLTPTEGDGQVSLAWTEAADGDLASTVVYRGTVSGTLAELATVAAGTETYVDSAAANGTTYYYAVSSRDTTGNESAQSAEVTATPAAGVLSSASLDLTFAETSGSFVNHGSAGGTFAPTGTIGYLNPGVDFGSGEYLTGSMTPSDLGISSALEAWSFYVRLVPKAVATSGSPGLFGFGGTNQIAMQVSGTVSVPTIRVWHDATNSSVIVDVTGSDAAASMEVLFTCSAGGTVSLHIRQAGFNGGAWLSASQLHSGWTISDEGVIVNTFVDPGGVANAGEAQPSTFYRVLGWGNQTLVPADVPSGGW